MSKFDLTKTSELSGLFETPRDGRDSLWMQRFFSAVPEATLASFTPQVEIGPDEFPYFHMSIPAPGPLTPFCITHVLDFVLDNGTGIAIFGDPSRENGPEWVFSYGDLLSYSLYGRFDGNPAELDDPHDSGAGKSEILQAAPSESYFPARARRSLGQYMRNMFQHPDPKIALIVDRNLHPQKNLMVNLRLEHYDGDQEKLDAAMRYLLWFVPRTYSLLSMPADWNDSTFITLE